jgi:hypothetical protein
MKSVIAAISIALALSACTDAERAQIGAFGNKFEVTLYSASGSVIKQWESNGKVATEDHSDGWYFMDAATGKLVRVSGSVVVEHMD